MLDLLGPWIWCIFESRDMPCPTALHCATVPGFGAGLGRTPHPSRDGGRANATATVPMCFFYCFFINFYQHCKKLIYGSCGTCLFIFKPVLGRVVFSLTLPWTGWFRNYQFLDMEGHKLCEKSALLET